MKIIDAHTHVIENPIWVKKADVNDLIKNMDEAGIDKSVILSGEKHQTSIKELIKLKNDRFEIVYTIDMFGNLKAQEKEVKDLFEKGQIKGLKILLGYTHIMPDDKKFEPFYKLCEKYDLPMIFHTGDTLAGVVKNPKLIYAHPLNLDSVATDRPKLKIIIAHIGNPWTIDAGAVIYKNKNVYGDLSGFFLDFKDKNYIDLMKRKVNDFIAYVGGDKLLFGTDFPLVEAIDYLKFVKSLDLNKEELELTLYKNAEKLFKLK